MHQRTAVAEGLEHITELIRRYTLVEGIYLSHECTGLVDELKAAIKRLYKLILEYEAKAICQMNRITAYQTARNVVVADSWKEMLEGIKLAEKTCKQLMQRIDAMNQQRSLQNLDEHLKQQDQKSEELWSGLLVQMKTLRQEQQNQHLDDEMTKCLQISRTSPYESHKSRNPERVDGTCQWVTKHPHYQRWRSNGQANLLWISADPGCGKSVLSKFLIDQELDNKSHTICYFFFKDDDERQKQGTSALCALLHQLFIDKPALLKHAQAAFCQNGEKITEFFEVLWKLLVAVADDDDSGHIICVLDALDECEEESRFRLIDNLIEYSRNPPNSGQQNRSIKFLVTSRPYFEIENRFCKLTQSLLTIQLSGEYETESISREIDLVIKAKVREIGFGLHLDDSTTAYLETKLLSVPNRTYLWLSLILHEIKKSLASTQTRLGKVIDALPVTLDATYEAILGKSTDPNKARDLLHIVVSAARPLTLTEMNIALNMDEEHESYEDLKLEQEDLFRTRIRNLCGLFIQVVDFKIYLIHQTAKEFLISSKPKENSTVDSGAATWKNSLDVVRSNFVVAKICISYLRWSLVETWFRESDGRANISNPHPPVDEYEYMMQYSHRHPLLDYAVRYWVTHFQRSKSLKSTIFESALTIFDTSSMSPPLWFFIYRFKVDRICIKFSQVQEYTHLIMAASVGLKDMVTFMLDRGANVDAVCETQLTAFSIVVRGGHEPMVLALLDHNANTETIPVLSMAVKYQHEGIVRLLLERGADINGRNEDAHDQGVTPLYFAKHFKMTQLLLNHGANVGIKDYVGSTVLHQAAQDCWKVEVVELLLAHGAEIEARNEWGMTALHSAALSDDVDAIRLFTKAGADIEAKDVLERTVLSHAAWGDSQRVIKSLCKLGANVEAKDKEKGTALHFAAICRTDSALDSLCKFGANKESKDENGMTALHLATMRHHPAAVQALCTVGADIDAKDQNGMTALHHAVMKSHDDGTIPQLCKHGADIEATDRYGWTALEFAISKWGHDVAVVRVLLDHGAVEPEENYGLKGLFGFDFTKVIIFRPTSLFVVYPDDDLSMIV